MTRHDTSLRSPERPPSAAADSRWSR